MWRSRVWIPRLKRQETFTLFPEIAKHANRSRSFFQAQPSWVLSRVLQITAAPAVFSLKTCVTSLFFLLIFLAANASHQSNLHIYTESTHRSFKGMEPALLLFLLIALCRLHSFGFLLLNSTLYIFAFILWVGTSRNDNGIFLWIFGARRKQDGFCWISQLLLPPLGALSTLAAEGWAAGWSSEANRLSPPPPPLPPLPLALTLCALCSRAESSGWPRSWISRFTAGTWSTSRGQHWVGRPLYFIVRVFTEWRFLSVSSRSTFLYVLFKVFGSLNSYYYQ